MEIKEGCVYRHDKGEFYKVAKLTKSKASSYSNDHFIVRDEASLELLRVYCNDDYCWVETFEGKLFEQEGVVYFNTQKKAEHPWYRSVETFSGFRENGNPRFVLVDKQSATY